MHQCSRDAIDLAEQGADPGGSVGHLQAQEFLSRQCQRDFGSDRAQPVMAIGEHERLPVVPHLQQFFGTTMEQARARISRGDNVALKATADAEGTVA